MQLGMLKLLTTTGPFAPFGSITSIVPTVRSPVAFPFVTRNMPLLGLKADPPNPTRETAPAQPMAGATWLQNAPAEVRTGPRWQGTSLPPGTKLLLRPDTPDWIRVPDRVFGTEGSGQGIVAFRPPSSTVAVALFCGEPS